MIKHSEAKAAGLLDESIWWPLGGSGGMPIAETMTFTGQARANAWVRQVSFMTMDGRGFAQPMIPSLQVEEIQIGGVRVDLAKVLPSKPKPVVSGRVVNVGLALGLAGAGLDLEDPCLVLCGAEIAVVVRSCSVPDDLRLETSVTVDVLNPYKQQRHIDDHISRVRDL